MGVHVGVVAVVDLLLELGLPPGDHELRLDRLLVGGLVRFGDEGEGGLLVGEVLLGVQAPGLFDCHVQRVGVLVFQSAPVNVKVPGIELGVDDAVGAQLLIVPLLPVVELHDEVAVDLLHLSHAAVPSFQCLSAMPTM
ncbi:hypothetical protein SDC9_210566 [bioreactor metagenome]|uniref:Uncharacterized protein n=1 Tax=bioreactor metagenome TaxID=1076179 RepID=A0A645JU75_9ZZZZ